MHLRAAPILALLLAAKTSALALPQSDDSTASIDDANNEILDAINAALVDIGPVVAPPPANVTYSTPAPDPEAESADATAVAAAAVEDDTSSASKKRADVTTCKKQSASPFTPTGNANSLSAADWLQQSQFHTVAQSASTPSGFKPVTGYRDLYASAQMPVGKTESGQNILAETYNKLTSYDVEGCAARCRAIEGCVSFVLYFERSPVYHVDSKTCPGGPGQAFSDAQTYVRCVSYRQPVTAAVAKNTGSSPGGFSVRIAGANAYQISEFPYVDGFDEPVDLGDAAIKSNTVTSTSYMFVNSDGGAVYSPSKCGLICTATNDYVDKHPSKDPSKPDKYCNFFDAYYVTRSDITGGTLVCTFWSQVWGVAQATNKGQTRNGVTYSNTMSLGYKLTDQR